MTANTQSKTCPCCDLEARRVYSDFSFHRYTEHYNPSVGKVVSSDEQFRTELKKASEDATRRTGVEHNFVPMEMPGKIEERPGTESQFRTRRAMGDPRFQRRKSYFT